MGTDREPGWVSPGDDDIPELYEWDDAGPPTREDDLWFLASVIALGYPVVQRGERQFDGQSTIYDFI